MDPKSAAREGFESAREGLIELSHRIHGHPELGFEEEKASTWLCESLADAGFAVEQGIGDLPTAFSCQLRIRAAMMVHPAPFDMLRAKIIAASM